MDQIGFKYCALSAPIQNLTFPTSTQKPDTAQNAASARGKQASLGASSRRPPLGDLSDPREQAARSTSATVCPHYL